MELQVIREGSKGALVLAWEEFLRDEQCYLVEVDGFFDPSTVTATKEFQKKYSLDVDGAVGGETWGKALQLGFHALADDSADKSSSNWPPKPNFGPTDYRQREELFGHIVFRPAPLPSNPEGVEITNGWPTNYLVNVELPQLTRVSGILVNNKREGRGPKDNMVAVHKRVAQPLLDLWKLWEDEGLLDRVLTWAGMWNPRFVRGSRSVLSNHAYGSAFDINAPWNGLMRTPARLGQKGCVRELVPHANRLKWFWLGHNDKRPDGMHFEYVG